MSLEIILHDVSKGGSTEIDIWEKLVHYFSENWDGQDIFQRVKNLSRKQLGRDVDDIKNTSQYFRALENNFSDKNDLLEFIINLTSFLNFHTECGSINIPEKLQTFRKTLRKFRELCVRRGIFRDKNFVGREAEIEKVKTEINGNEGKKGILICGMGGMGKTSLASTICYELRCEDWKTTKIELREQRNFWHFLRTTMRSISDLRGAILGHVYTAKSAEEEDKANSADEETIMKQKLFDYLMENMSRKRIYMFDNIDDVTSDIIEKEKIMQFFKELLSEFKDHSRCMIRIILTSRENFLTSSTDMKRLMTAIEVNSLDRDSGIRLVSKCTHHGQTILSAEIMHSVVSVCGGCPLAIRVICGIMNTSPLALIKNLEKQAWSLSASFLQVHDCLQQPYERLEEYKPTLCKLSLFGTAKFDLHSATMVVYGEKSEEETKQNHEKLQLILLLLKSRHLLEIDNYFTDDIRDNEIEPDKTVDSSLLKIFSLHPLVYKFLEEKSNKENMFQEMKKAKYNFIALFNDVVREIGDAYDTNITQAREMSEKVSTHISKYIQLLEELETTCISNEPAVQNALSNEQSILLCKTIGLTHNPQEKISFFKDMFLKTEEGTITNCGWQVEHITVMVRYDMQCDRIEEKCDNVIAQLEKLEANKLTLIYKSRMLNNKGKIVMEIGDGRNSIDIFEKGITILKSKCLLNNTEAFQLLADMFNSIGCVHYKNSDFKKSLQCHGKAVKISEKNELHNDSILIYRANLGACHFRMGLQHNRDNNKTKMKSEMEIALKYYDDSIATAKLFKADATLHFTKTLKNRGDIFFMLKRFEDSEKDYKTGLDIETKLNSYPTRRRVILRHALGELYREQIKEMNRKGKSGSLSYREHRTAHEDENESVFEKLCTKGLDIYEGLIRIIDAEILPSDDIYYRKIRRNHIRFLEMSSNDKNMIERTKAVYMNYEGGKVSPDEALHSGSEESADLEDDNKEQCGKNCNIANTKELNNGQKPDNSCCGDEYPSSNTNENDNGEVFGKSRHVIARQTQIPQIKTQESLSYNLQKDEIHIPVNDHESDIARKDRFDSLALLNEKRQHFKLSFTSLKPLQHNDPSFCLPMKISKRRGSSSSSGVSSLGTITPDLETGSCKSASIIREISQEMSLEDEVFWKGKQRDDKGKDSSFVPSLVRRHHSLKSFGSGLLSYDGEESIVKKQKFDKRPPMPKSASMVATSTTALRKQDWIMTDKLCSWFENTEKGCQTDKGTLDNFADDIGILIPSTKPRIRTLLHMLDTDQASLIDDQKGRPIIQYADERFQDEKETKE